MFRDLRFVTVVGFLLLICFQQPSSTAGTYAVLDLTMLQEARGGVIRGINANGEIVGTFRSGAGRRGFRLGAFESLMSGTRAERLDGFAGADGSSANAINGLGAIVGAANTDDGIRAFLWSRLSGYRELGALPGDSGSEGTGVNLRNDVVGYSSGPAGIQAVLWERNEAPLGLGWLRNGDYSRATAINEGGVVVGTSGQASSTRAFLWTRAAGMQDLGTIAGNDQSFATALNERREVVGHTTGPLGDRAFRWTSAQGLTNLGVLPAGGHSRATSINDSGDIVGVSDSPHGNRAVIWPRGGDAEDLNDLIQRKDIVLRDAITINNLGQILVTGHDNEGSDVEHQHDHSRREPTLRVFLLLP